MLLAVALLAAPVTLVDGLRNQANLSPAEVSALDGTICVEVEKAFKASGLEVKCKADQLAILELHRLRGRSGMACEGDLNDCAQRTAKMLACTHTVVAVVTPAKLDLHLVDERGQSLVAATIKGRDFSAWRAGLPGAAAKLSAKLKP